MCAHWTNREYSSSFMHGYSTVAAQTERAVQKRVCVAQARRGKSFSHLSDLNGVSSCWVVISWALQGCKDQCSWCLPPSWKEAHYSSSPYQQAPAACVTPFPIADLWLLGWWVLAYCIFSRWHMHTHTLRAHKIDKAQIVPDLSSTCCTRGSQTCLRGHLYHTHRPLYTCRLAHRAKWPGKTKTLSPLTQMKYKWTYIYLQKKIFTSILFFILIPMQLCMTFLSSFFFFCQSKKRFSLHPNSPSQEGSWECKHTATVGKPPFT